MIEIRGVEKTFVTPGGDQLAALQGINLTIPTGQFLTVIGTNGSGKSTLLNALAGTFLPDAGTITIDGKDVTRAPEHRRAGLIGRVFQDPYKGTCPSMTVAENMRMAELRGLRRVLRLGLNAACRVTYHDLLKRLRMRVETRLDALIGTLSGGQRQAITLMMATIRRPSLLLLDEHTAALDPRAAEQVLMVTREVVSEYQLTTLMVTHSMEQALELGDRTIMMHRGAIVEDLSGEERKSTRVSDLLERFAKLRHTIEYTAQFSTTRE
ncbi:MAG TPA: ATP-binding cassette domain-containing protein [Gemmatimonadales bacterium]|nr:ATP-binding cassette domain-containing protein [Gemmatimonadales bacterium]